MTPPRSGGGVHTTGTEQATIYGGHQGDKLAVSGNGAPGT